MANTRLPHSIFVALLVVAAAQSAYYAPRLPDILAGHFGASGVVNGWQTKIMFFSMELGMIVLSTCVTLGIPRIIAAMPVSVINLPNKDFWLSPERREDTLAFLREQFAWFGCTLLGFLLLVMELVFRANLRTPPQLDNAAFVAALLAFLLFTGIWTIRMILRFSRAPR